jgi:NAD(P)-dependent dehydrogenase (short-subunit alcohol dehydrogenase family)
MRYMVTGANRGIGLEFARTLAGRGDEVVATARDPEDAVDLNALAADSNDRVRVLALDIADAESVEQFAAELGDTPIDVVINNAGRFTRSGSFDELDFDALFTDFEVNTVGTLRVIQAVLDNVRAGDSKVICNVTSKMGSISDNGSGGSYAYRISKAALNMGTRSLAMDLRDEGITAFVVHPGWVETDMGGPNAHITTQKSVDGLLEKVDNATLDDAGRFWEWNGNEIPW